MEEWTKKSKKKRRQEENCSVISKTVFWAKKKYLQKLISCNIFIDIRNRDLNTDKGTKKEIRSHSNDILEKIDNKMIMDKIKNTTIRENLKV